MSARIQTNIDAFRAHRNLTTSETMMARSMEKLSSGYRINRAADDAAGLAISERLRAQVGGLQQAQRNVGDGVSLIQTAEGALDQVHAILQRTRELAVKYNNSTLSATDRAAITAEVAQLSAEVARIATNTQFNGINLLTGSTTPLTFQVGADDNQTISVTTGQLIGTGADQIDMDLFNFGTSTTSIASVDAAVTNVSSRRGAYGAVQNRLEFTAKNLATYEENLTESLSRVKDTDMASEMVRFTKAQILAQSGTAMLAQANTLPQSVLSLLR